MIKRYLLIMILGWYSGASYPQEMAGLVMGNYSGINSLMVNPALMINSKLYLDVNLLTAGGFIQNNYIFWSNRSCATWEILSREPDMAPFGPEGYAFYDYYGPDHNDKLKHAYAQTRIRLPGFMLAHQNHAFALSIEQRNHFSARNVPYHMAKFAYEGFDYRPQQNIEYLTDDVRLDLLMITDISLSYALTLSNVDRNWFSGGITLHYLVGNGGAYFDVEEIDYSVPNDSLLLVEGLNAGFGYSLPLRYDRNGPAYEGGISLGKGFGMDLGFTYQRLAGKGGANKGRFCAVEFEPYIYRLGISLMDVGSVRFKEHAEAYTISNGSTIWPGVDTVHFRDLEDFSTRLSDQFFGDPDMALSGTGFRIGMPAVLSIQGDWNIFGGFYAGAMYFHPLRLSQYQVRRPANLYIVPRFENRWFELSAPVSFYDHQEPRLGISMRVLSVTMGVDNITCLNPLEFKGMNFYASAKINLEKGSCADKARSGRARAKGGASRLKKSGGSGGTVSKISPERRKPVKIKKKGKRVKVHLKGKHSRKKYRSDRYLDVPCEAYD